ncbi:MAG: T9SS type A sorting domain-containing protein [Saprospiraceae bacterium]|nr:T9SS type A sorting domain-containing protein [Saprospiraceae bacterium]
MNIRFFFNVLFLALLSQNVVAQGFLNTLTQGSFGVDLTQTPDGGYVVVGGIRTDSMLAADIPQNAWVAYVDPNGARIWEKHIDVSGRLAFAVCTATDGSIVWVSQTVLVPDASYSSVVKMNGAGQILWQTDLPLSEFGDFTDIVATNDGGVYVFGSDTSSANEFDFRLVRLDAGGTVVWDKFMGKPLLSDISKKMLVLETGDLLLAGGDFEIDTNSVGRVTVLKADPDGNFLWQKWYSKPENIVCAGIAAIDSNQIAVLVEMEDVSYHLLSIDKNGEETDFHEIVANVPDYNTSTATAICTDGSDGYMVTGILESGFPVFGPIMNFIQKIDADGQLVWTKTYPIENGVPYNIVRSFDGGYATAGYLFMQNIPGTGFHAFLLKTNAAGELYSNVINGLVFHDANDNCTLQTGEPTLGQFTVRIQKSGGETLYTTTQSDGTWTTAIGQGSFTLSVSPRFGAGNIWQACNLTPITINSSYQTVQAPPTGVRSLVDCPYLDIDLAAQIFRPCLETVANVSYCNNGNQPAEDAYLELAVDPMLSYVSSNVPLTAQNGDTYRFDLGDVGPGMCSVVTIEFFVDCAATLGETVCMEAHIYPDTSCTPPDPLWDGSHLVVNGDCAGNEITFTVTNEGLGDMSEAVDFVIIEDQIIYMEGLIQLDAGQDSVFTIPNTAGNTYYMSVDQTPFHPGNSHPVVGVEYCDGPANTPGLLLQLAQDEADVFVATHCDIVRIAYDPNDKRGFPLGWQDANFIERGQELDYMIRFQNTGNDTAFLVVLRDTIDQTTLDITSIRPGASSHPYTWELTGNGVLNFTFENILLPDSNTNLDASQGYVQVRIRQQPDLVAGTQILNSAGIYFDFNAPVITNTSMHTIADDLVSVSTDAPNAAPGVGLQVFPNPFVDQAQFVLEGLEGSVQPRISVYNTAGLLVRQEQHNQSTFTFRRAGLETGMYFYRVEDQFGKVLAGGRIMVGGN